MVTPERLFRLILELIFVMLGGLVVWLGITGHIFFDRRAPGWLILSVALILWGVRALIKPDKWWSPWETRTRGISLILLGLVMLVISRVPFSWVGTLLAAVGVLLVLRGILGSMLVFRPR